MKVKSDYPCVLIPILFLFNTSSKLELWSPHGLEVFLSFYICLANYFDIKIDQWNYCSFLAGNARKIWHS